MDDIDSKDTREKLFNDTKTLYIRLTHCITAENYEGAKILLEESSGLDPYLNRPWSVRNPILVAAVKGNVALFDLLVKYGFSPSIRDIDEDDYRHPKLQPIHLAAQNGHVNLVKKLVEIYHASVNAEAGRTVPLHLAVRDRHTEVVRYLVQQGACPLFTPNGSCRFIILESPLSTATNLGYWELVSIMIESLRTIDVRSFVYHVDFILKAKRNDVAFALYSKLHDKRITPLTKEIPSQAPLKVLHFLLAVRYPPLYDDIYPGSICAFIMTEQNRFTLCMEAGCPLTSSDMLAAVDVTFPSRGRRLMKIDKNLVLEYAKPSSPVSLRKLSVFSIRRAVFDVTPERVESLPIPSSLKSLVKLEHLLAYCNDKTSDIANFEEYSSLIRKMFDFSTC